MIDKETLKKHNLKAIPFECVGEGETFNDWQSIISHPKDLPFYARRLKDENIFFADGCPSVYFASNFANETVYVPVWRVCREVAK